MHIKQVVEIHSTLYHMVAVYYTALLITNFVVIVRITNQGLINTFIIMRMRNQLDFVKFDSR